MRPNHVLVVVAAVALAAACAPGSTAPADAGYRDIGPAEFAAMLESDDVLFVNTHIPYEGEVEGTDAFIPFDQIDAFADQLPSDRAAPIALYCRSGRMSSIAAATLAEMGYSNLYNLDGGMIAWEQAGFPLRSP